MTYQDAKRFHGTLGCRILRYLAYRKIRKLAKRISREIDYLESRLIKSRVHQA